MITALELLIEVKINDTPGIHVNGRTEAPRVFLKTTVAGFSRM